MRRSISSVVNQPEGFRHALLVATQLYSIALALESKALLPPSLFTTHREHDRCKDIFNPAKRDSLLLDLLYPRFVSVVLPPSPLESRLRRVSSLRPKGHTPCLDRKGVHHMRFSSTARHPDDHASESHPDETVSPASAATDNLDELRQEESSSTSTSTPTRSHDDAPHNSSSDLCPDPKSAQPGFFEAKQHRHWKRRFDVSRNGDYASEPVFANLQNALASVKTFLEEVDEVDFVSGAKSLRRERNKLAQNLWRCYLEVCHMERFPLYVRFLVGDYIAFLCHRFMVDKEDSADLRIASFKYGHRLSQLGYDGKVFFQRAQQSAVAPQITENGPNHSWQSLSEFEAIRLKFDSHNTNTRAMAMKGLSSEALQRFVECFQKPEFQPLMSEIFQDMTKLSQRETTQTNRQIEINQLKLTAAILLDSFLVRSVNTASRDEILAKMATSTNYVEPSALEGFLVVVDNPPETDALQRELLQCLFNHPRILNFFLLPFESNYRRIKRIFCMTDDPSKILNEVLGSKGWATTKGNQIVNLFLTALAEDGSILVAIKLFKYAAERRANISETVIRKLITGSERASDPHVTESLISLVSHLSKKQADNQLGSSVNLSPSILRTIALYWAREGRMDKLDAAMAQLSERETDSAEVERIQNLTRIEYFTSIGDADNCLKILSNTYDLEAVQSSELAQDRHLLDAFAIHRILKACSLQDDLETALHFWHKLQDIGIMPTPAMFSFLIQLYSRRTDIESALQVFKQMQDVQVRPDKFTFTTLMHAFTLRRDPEGALHTFKAMLAHGILPDLVAYGALMNTYVESGSWDAAIGLFRWLCRSQNPTLRPTTKICNILLKAHVLRAMPIQTVMKFVAEMRTFGLELNSNTFSLMLVSASDAGMMDVAEDIFTEAERQLSTLPGQGANLYHFTIMIHGYLRLGNHAVAKEFFDEMRERGVQPSSITWGTLVQSYVESDNETNFNLARNLVGELVSKEISRNSRSEKWKVPALKQGPPLEYMFSPMLIAHVRRREPDEAEKTVETLLDSGSGLSIFTLTMLLDSYRRVMDVEKALQLFTKIYETAVEATRVDIQRLYPQESDADDNDLEEDLETSSEKEAPRRSHLSTRNILCLPMSVMIELLASAGRHEEIARFWNKAKSDGFGFDSHNWNHLARAMAGAGQLDEAMAVVEKVLNKPQPVYYDTGRRVEVDRALRDILDEKASSSVAAFDSLQIGMLPQEKEPLSAEGLLDTHLDNGEDGVRSPSRPPNRRHQNRINDNPYFPLPFDEETEDSEGAGEPEQAAPKKAMTSLSDKLLEHREIEARFSPWYAHFETLQSIAEGLERLRANSDVAALRLLLDKYPIAAGRLDQHRSRIEIMEEKRWLAAQRSSDQILSV